MLTRDKINQALEDAGLDGFRGGLFHCRKISIDYHPTDTESDIIHDQNNNPVFDCGWTNWETKVQKFIKEVKKCTLQN